ncbi:MAG: AmmeMemoRadiSam system protein A [Deltaproteobacteria bacterium]|nr:AmmeMemoRadiSam system protein A [Deltaproteobacteria bacterium]
MQTRQGPTAHEGPGAALDLPTREWLLAWARTVIQSRITSDSAAELSTPPPAATTEPRGCFVSLHTRAGALRGCIGTFEASRPLWKAVQEMAIAAATHDPRFPAVTAAELGDCVIEISALTPCQKATPESIQVGVHGIAVERGYHRGVLLPQVATEYGWDRETFLDHTCMKAGMPKNAWRDGSVSIETFGAEVFSETAH